MPFSIHLLLNTKHHRTAQRLIEATIELIEQNGGCRGVNIRLIAKHAQCAHTNIYKYFDSLDSLLWAAVLHAFKLQSQYITSRMNSPEGEQAPLKTFIEAQIEYVQEHPTYYRLFWFEHLPMPPPADAIEYSREMRAHWIRLITCSPEDAVSHLQREWPGPVLHSFFHGEICKLIGRNALIPKETDAKDRIVRLTLHLAEVLKNSV